MRAVEPKSPSTSGPADRTRRHLYALVAVNLAIAGLIAAFFWHHQWAQDRIFDKVVNYHTMVVRTVQTSLAELHYVSDTLWRRALVHEGPGAFASPGHEAAAGHNTVADHTSALAGQREIIFALQQRFADPQFADATDSALRALDPILLIGSPADPTQGDFSAQRELIENLDLLLQELLKLHLEAQDRMAESSLHTGFSDPAYLFVMVGLLTGLGLVIGMGVIHTVAAASADRETALHALRQNETRLSRLAESLESAQRIARIGNWEWDAESGAEWWSDENYRIIGFEPGTVEAANITFVNTIHEEDRQEVIRTIELAERTATPYSIDFRVVFPDGEEHFIREIGEPIFDSKGRQTGQRGTIQDITEQHLVETELAEAVRRLESAQRIARVADWEWDPDSQFLDWPPQMRAVLGLPPTDEPIRNESFLAMIHPDDRESLRQHIRRAVEQGEPYAMEYRFQPPDDGIRTIMEYGEPFTPSHSGKVRLRGTVQDLSELRDREAELHQVEQRFSLAFQLSPSATAISEVETGIHIDVNDKWVEILGHSRDEALGRTAAELGIWANPEDRARAVSLLKKHGRFRDFEAQYRTRRGELRDFLISAEPFPIGDRPHMLIVGYDITERKAMEAELRETADRLEKSQRVGKIGSWVWEFDEDKEWWSDQVYRIYGLEVDEIVPNSFDFLDYVHPDDREKVRAGLEKSIHEGVPYTAEYRVRRADGPEIIVFEHSEVEYDADGKPVRLRGTAQDITERKKAELALRETKERLEEAQHLGHMGSWTWDPEEDVEWWSDEQFRMFGLEPGSAIMDGWGFLKYVHPEDINRVDEVMRRAVDANTPFKVEYRIVRPNGAERVVSEQAEPLSDHAASKPFWRGVTQDITERKRIEQDLAQLNAELEQRVEDRTAELRAAQEELVRRERLATLGQLTATVSHELRNPLGAIRTSLYVVEKKTAQGDSHLSSAIGRMNRSITRCDNIIDELLDFTRMRNLEFEPLSLDKCLARLLADQSVPEGISVRRNFNMGDAKVSVDPDRLRRAVINIYENACQAMKPIGTAAGAPRSGHRLSITTRLNRNRAEIVFEDTGPGIGQDSQDRIFEPLFSTKNFGVGLGLPIVRQIMEQHGGGVEAANRKNGGARFVLWLPLDKQQENPEVSGAETNSALS